MSVLITPLPISMSYQHRRKALTKHKTVDRSFTQPPAFLGPAPCPPGSAYDSPMFSLRAFVDKNPPDLQPDNEPPSSHAAVGTITALGSYLYSRQRP